MVLVFSSSSLSFSSAKVISRFVVSEMNWRFRFLLRHLMRGRSPLNHDTSESSWAWWIIPWLIILPDPLDGNETGREVNFGVLSPLFSNADKYGCKNDIFSKNGKFFGLCTALLGFMNLQKAFFSSDHFLRAWATVKVSRNISYWNVQSMCGRV